MPGMYSEGEYDIAGFTVGIVDKAKIINGTTISPGDTVIGLASSGVHSNGFSLVRRLCWRKPGWICMSKYLNWAASLGMHCWNRQNLCKTTSVPAGKRESKRHGTHYRWWIY